MLLGQNKNNAVINGRFDFWQRGTSFSGAIGYSADRWRRGGDFAGSATISRQTFALGQTEVPGNPEYFLRWQMVGNLGNAPSLGHRIEDVRTFAGKKATLVFWAKSSGVTTNVTLNVNQHFGTGGSPSSNVTVLNQPLTIAIGWNKYEFTITIPSVSGKTLGTDGNDYLDFNILWPTGSNTWNVDLANFQMVEGDGAGDFELAGYTLPGELQLCQRYFEVFAIGWNGQATSTAN
jgi:hypothetical protein